MRKFLDKYFPIELRLLFKWIIFFALIFLALPLTSYLLWKGTPKNKLEVVTLDKTVPFKEQGEFQSIQWVLNHLKYTKLDGSQYLGEFDYWGYYPSQDSEEFLIKDFSTLSEEETNQLVDNLDVLYISDTYGVYEDDFGEGQGQTRSKKIYGGMDRYDLEIIKKSMEREKVIITEFNSIASPTDKQIRTEFEELMEMRWTGWIGRYFDELDTILNEEIPMWMINTYKKQHQNTWNFRGAGLIFLHENGRIEVMENISHLADPIPSVISNLKAQSRFGLPEMVKYPYWFDIMLVSREYEVISYYDIHPTEEGVELLREMGLPRYFPAVVHKSNGKGSFYYFSGDYSDNRIADNSYQYKGIAKLWRMFLHADDFSQRRSFFWNFYYPMMKEILRETNSKRAKG